LVLVKGRPLAYNRDLQEDKEPLFDSVATVLTMVPALAGAVLTLRFNTDVMARAAGDGMLLATDVAEYLVSKGVSFRDAHDIVGTIVQRALTGGRSIADIPLEELKALSDAFADDVLEVLDARASVDRRSAPGPSAASVDAQLSHLDAALAQIRSIVS
jgi:argininosuccinate lyase